MQHIVNAQGLNMPKLGLGTWPMLGEECTRAVEQALALGYRHIDTAAAYNNEDAVGQALANSPTPREQIHVTTKVWWDQLQPDAMRHSMDRSLKALRSEYVDLFMLHWPSTDWDLPRTIETLVSFKEQGLARNIGVANFPLPLLRTVVEELGAPLSAIQVEYHVLLGQNALLDYARQHDLALTAYSPLARNKVSDIPQRSPRNTAYCRPRSRSNGCSINPTWPRSPRPAASPINWPISRRSMCNWMTKTVP